MYTFIPSVTGVAQAGKGLGAFSISTKHMRQLATIDNYVLEKNIFSLLKYAQSPSELIGWSLPIVDKQEGTKVEPLIELFKELNYIKQENHNDK